MASGRALFGLCCVLLPQEFLLVCFLDVLLETVVYDESRLVDVHVRVTSSAWALILNKPAVVYRGGLCAIRSHIGFTGPLLAAQLLVFVQETFLQLVIGLRVSGGLFLPFYRFAMLDEVAHDLRLVLARVLSLSQFPSAAWRV